MIAFTSCYYSQIAILLTAIIIPSIFAIIHKSRNNVPRGGYTVITSYNNPDIEGPTRRHRISPDRDIISLEGEEDVKTLYDMFELPLRQKPNDRALGVRKLINVHKDKKVVHGETKDWEFFEMSDYKWFTYSEVNDMVHSFGSGLASISLKPYDKLAIYEETRLEWTVACHAAFAHSAIVLTVYANLGQDALVYALNLGEVKFLVTNGKFLGNLANVVSQIKSLKIVIYIDEAHPESISQLKSCGINVIRFKEVEEIGKSNPTNPFPPKPDDIAMIMFTSGSTSIPKGVVLKHKSIVATAIGSYVLFHKLLGISSSDVYISFLPFAHILAFILQIIVYYRGVPIGYGSARTLTDTNMKNCLGDIKLLKPTFFVGVPIVYESIKSGVEAKIKEKGAIFSNIFNLAFELKRFLRKLGLPTFVLNSIIFNRLKKEMGGRVRLCITGGASINPTVQEFVEICFNTRILQGYGLTETSGVVTIQEYSDTSTGSAGVPICALSLKLLDIPEMEYTNKSNPQRGEILIKGPTLFSEYYKDPDQTAQAFTSDGWFRTGDIGEWSKEGSLKIIDRVKNLIKPLHGEYIALDYLETKLRNCKLVQFICVYVDSMHKDVVALLVPSQRQFSDWLNENGFKDIQDPYHNPRVVNQVLKELKNESIKQNLKSIEMVRAIKLINDEWCPENDMLTASQKLKRHNIFKKYKSLIDEMYADLDKN